MSNWDPLLDAAGRGVLPTIYPPDLPIPMVAPADPGAAAARFFRELPDRTGIRHVEGPARHSSRDVAAAFARGRSAATSRSPSRRGRGGKRRSAISACPAAAVAYTRMTAFGVEGDFDMPVEPERGTVTLSDYIDALVKRTRDASP